MDYFSGSYFDTYFNLAYFSVKFDFILNLIAYWHWKLRKSIYLPEKFGILLLAPKIMQHV